MARARRVPRCQSSRSARDRLGLIIKNGAFHLERPGLGSLVRDLTLATSILVTCRRRSSASHEGTGTWITATTVLSQEPAASSGKSHC